MWWSREGKNNSEKQSIRMTAQEANAKGFFFRINGKNCKIMSYRGHDKEIIIPAYINNKPVRVIGKGVFAGKEIRRIILPDTIRTIREKAFYETKIEKIELPGDVLIIEENAFGKCKYLQEVTLGEVKERARWNSIKVNADAFLQTPYIEHSAFIILDHILLRINTQSNHMPIRIPDGVEVIGKEVTKSNWDIEQIEIPYSVRKIRERAFIHVYHLKKVIIEETDKWNYLSIEKEAFGTFKRWQSRFCWDLLYKQLQSDWGDGTGWKRFKQIEIRNSWEGWTGIGEAEIYFPVRDQIRDELLQKLKINYTRGTGREFIFSLEIKDYYELMMKNPRMVEQIEMAICIILNEHGSYRKMAIEFLKQHINKAVHIAVESNNWYNIKLFHQQGLLQKDTGIKVRHCQYLIEQYTNLATRYLAEAMKE